MTLSIYEILVRNFEILCPTHLTFLKKGLRRNVDSLTPKVDILMDPLVVPSYENALDPSRYTLLVETFAGTNFRERQVPELDFAGTNFRE